MIDFLLIEIALSTFWFWITLGCILLAVEVFATTAGYLFLTSIAAFLVALILWVFPPLGWSIALLLFAILCIIVTLSWYKWSSKFGRKAKIALNDRISSLKGIKTYVMEIQDGKARIKIADGSYRAECSEPLTVGDWVEVVDSKGIYLVVKKITNISSQYQGNN